MVIRIFLFALMALGLAGFGSIAWIATHPQATPEKVAAAPAPPPPPATTHILVAAHQLKAGGLMKLDDLTDKEVPVSEVPTGAPPAAARNDLAGGMIRRSLAPGDAVLADDVLRPGDHGFLAAVLGKGMRATTVGVDAVTGTAGLIWPGDRVDLILTQALDDNTIPLGRRVSAETVLADVRVIAIDQQLMQGSAPGLIDAPTARTVTLEVTPEQAERVAVAVRLGKLSLAVRSAAPVAAAPPVSPNATETTWGSDVSPALRTTPAGVSNTLHVFSGTSEGKEFHF